MPGPILHLGATVTCTHGGQAVPTAPNPRVLVSGQPVSTIAAPGGNGPCVSAQWVVGATRVLVAGQPVAIQAGQSVCAPTGTPMLPLVAQTRVIAM